MVNDKLFHIHMYMDGIQRHWSVPKWKLTVDEVEWRDYYGNTYRN